MTSKVPTTLEQKVEQVNKRVKFLEYKLNLLMDNLPVLPEGQRGETVLAHWKAYKERKEQD